MPPLLISFCIGHATSLEEVKALPQMCLHACYSEVLLYFEMMFSGVHEAIIKLIYIVYIIHETRGRKLHYGQLKRSRHGPRCGHTPLDIAS